MAIRQDRQEGIAPRAAGAFRAGSPWEKIPLVTAGAVFIPIALTSLIYVFTFVRDGISAVSTAFPMLPLAVYVGMNCLLVAAGILIFRGFLLSLLGSRIRHRWQVGIIGVFVFTFIHIFYFGWGGALFMLLWSPLAVGLFLWRKSIYPALVFHVISNVAAYVVIPAVTHR